MDDSTVAGDVDAGRSLSYEPMAGAERLAFERDGYLVVRGVLAADEVVNYAAAIDDLYERRRRSGRLGAGGALHELSAVYTCPALAPLVDQPAIVGRLCSVLGWNVHVYHSHIDVHPHRGPAEARRAVARSAARRTGDSPSRRRRAVRPAGLARPLGEQVEPDPQGGVLRVHVPVDPCQGPDPARSPGAIAGPTSTPRAS